MTNASKKSVKQNLFSYCLLTLAGLFYSYQFVVRSSPNMLTDELTATFSVDITKLGNFASYYYIAYALSLIPLGLLMDKFRPQKLFSIGSILCAVSCFIFAYTSNFEIACLSRLIFGVGASCGFLGTVKIGTLYLPPKHLSKVVALAMVFGTIGGALSQTPLEFLINFIGWRSTFVSLGITGIIFSLLFLIFSSHSPRQNLKEFQDFNIRQSLKTVASSTHAWSVAIYSMLMYMPIIIIGDFIGASFLERLYHIAESEAGKMITAMFIGIGVGSPCFSILSDKLHSRRQPMLIGTLLCLASYTVIIYSNNIPIWSMYIFFFLSGFFFGGKTLGYATIVEYMPANLSGLAVGFCNTLVMGGGAIGTRVTGYLIDLRSPDNYAQNIMRSYTFDDIKFALNMIPICIGISIITLLLIKETYPKTIKKSK